MAYDEDLADRIRGLLGEEGAVTEQRMFGGLAFLVGGHMAVAASGQGGLLARVDPAELDALVADTPAEPMEMRGRPMRGWVHVAGAALGTDRELGEWLRRGVDYARTLPPKEGRPAPRA